MNVVHKNDCYFGEDDCQGQLWTCQTCGDRFCETHFHVTAKGRNVECCACEYNAADYARDYQEGRAS